MAMNYTSSGPVGTVAFMAYSTPTQALPSSPTTIIFATEVFDQGSNWASPTFTAPVTGKYMFNWLASVQSPDHDSSHISFELVVSNRAFSYATILDPDFGSGNYFPLNGAMCADMDANDTANLLFSWSSGTGATYVRDYRYFSGHLVA